MKCLNQTIALLLLITFICTKATPQAENLSNHYGTDVNSNKYGPNHSTGVNLRREGVSPGKPVSPITNFEKEITPARVASGDLDNTAFDATKIVKPHLAHPKAEILTTFHHEAIVKTPVHLGTRTEENTITTMNRVNGQIDSKQVTTEKPIVGVLNQLKRVETKHTTMVDLNTGKVEKKHDQKSLHGKF